MKLQNTQTGDILEIPRPDEIGQSVVLLNGNIVARVLYSDDNGGSVTMEDGRMFTINQWVSYVADQLRKGAWKQKTGQ